MTPGTGACRPDDPSEQCSSGPEAPTPKSNRQTGQTWTTLEFRAQGLGFSVSGFRVFEHILSCAYGNQRNVLSLRPQRTYLFKDVYQEIKIRNPKIVGSLGSR